MPLDESANNVQLSSLGEPEFQASDSQSPFGGLPQYTGSLEGAPRIARGGTNGFAIAAMILGVLPVLGGILGLIFGFVALDQIKHRGQKGRGYALTGVIAGGTWLLLSIAVVVGAVLYGSSSPDTSSSDNVSVGQCFNTPDSTVVRQVTIVDCVGEHTYQVFANYQATNTSYPGAAALESSALSRCKTLMPGAVQSGVITPQMEVVAFVPNSANWATSHTISCVIDENGADWTGSVTPPTVGP